MNFDPIAPHYRWLETLVFGSQLQEARTAFVRQIDPPEQVLIVGEGDGRFLAEFVKVHPRATIDCLEASTRMIDLARKRLPPERIRFILEDIRSAKLPARHYDLVVTHFVLDCLSERALPEVVAKLAGAAAPGANWLLADFREPHGGWQRWHARFWLWLMYGFFRLTTRLEAAELVDPSPFLCEAGFRLRAQQLSRFGMIKSQCWRS